MNDTLHWANPWLLLIILGAVPLLIFLAYFERRRAPALRFPLLGLVASGPRGLARVWWLPHCCRIIAVVFAVLALARPQIRGAKARDLSVEGIDIVVSLDVSTSMNAADFRPKDRISVAKEVLNQVIQQRTNDRIGLVVFAGEAYTQAPLTLDYHVLTEIVGSVQTGRIEDGTAIGNAIATSTNRLCEALSENSPSSNSPSSSASDKEFCKGGAKTKVIILITDGDNNRGNISPMQAASIAKEYGIRVFTIMVGKGGLVPFPAGPDLFGQPVFRQVEVPVNPELLKNIAKDTGGSFYNAIDRQTLEKGFMDILNQLEKTKLHQAGGYQNYTEMFGPLLLISSIFLLLEIVLSTTRLRSFP